MLFYMTTSRSCGEGREAGTACDANSQSHCVQNYGGTGGMVLAFWLFLLAWNAPVVPWGVATCACIGRNYKQESFYYCIKGMLKEQKSCWCSAFLSRDQSLLGWWLPQVWSLTYPPGSPMTASCNMTSCSWWQLLRAAHVVFFKVFRLCSTFCCYLVWNSIFWLCAFLQLVEALLQGD